MNRSIRIYYPLQGEFFLTLTVGRTATANYLQSKRENSVQSFHYLDVLSNYSNFTCDKHCKLVLQQPPEKDDLLWHAHIDRHCVSVELRRRRNRVSFQRTQLNW